MADAVYCQRNTICYAKMMRKSVYKGAGGLNSQVVLLLLENSLVMNLKRTQCQPFQPKHGFRFICGIAARSKLLKGKRRNLRGSSGF